MTQLRLSHHSLFKLLIASGMMLLMAVVMLLFSDRAFAHGYINSPESRAYLCHIKQNKDCGQVTYEPQSVEAKGLKGFPEKGPADGKIASAEDGNFSELDQQSATRWSKVPMTAGTQTFTWTLKAAHATTSWKYYITKQNWDQNAPLSRASFDLTPFCSVNDGGKKPLETRSDTCNVPSRTGYQVILAVWEVADTANAFHQVIDVNFG
ncbi:lytic polysaccharide monooxygenase, partial [Paenibacillus elgii]